MSHESLSDITTQWTQMEQLIAKEGTAALANYLAAKYFDALAAKFKKYRFAIDDLKAYEFASDVIYELIKNDYRGIQRLDRDRGRLRGLFFKIIKSQLYHLKSQQHFSLQDFDGENRDFEQWLDIYLDLEQCIEQLHQQRPRLFQPFTYYYLEGKTIAEIAEIMKLKPNAIKQRLFSARKYLAEHLQDYEKK